MFTPKSFHFAHQTDHIHTFLVTGISVFQRIPRWSLHWELLLDRYDIWNLGMQFGKLRKWNFNFPGTLSAAWIIWEHIASLSLFLIEERLLWKLTRRETGWHSSNIRCINENLGFLIARCGFRILCCRSRMAGTGFNIPCPRNVDSRCQSLARFRASYIEQAPAVQKLDNVIHWINPYPLDSAIGFAHTYPSDKSCSQTIFNMPVMSTNTIPDMHRNRIFT